MEITQKCTACGGSGIRTDITDSEGNPTTEDPCSYCGGDGKQAVYEVDLSGIDAKLDDIKSTLVIGFRAVLDAIGE